MVSVINVKEAVFDKHSFFNVKKFRLGTLHIERPVRTIDVSKTSSSYIPETIHPLYEISKNLRRGTVTRIIDSVDPNIFRKAIGIPQYLDEKEHFISLTFEFNPLKELGESIKDSLTILNNFFMYYYTYSPSVLLVPNVKITRTIVEGRRKKQIDIMKSDEYLKYVDESVEMLSYRNKKPIFVPLSLRFSIGSIGKIASHYARKGYTNIWIDFEGNSVSKGRIARIRKFLQVMESAELLNELVITATNVRREITTNINRGYTPASDILVSVTGANIIGVNKEPKRVVEGIMRLSKEELRKHKARVFDKETYYYFKASEASWLPEEERQALLNNPKYNVAKNIELTDIELNMQAKEFLAEQNLKDYLSQKNMLREYKGGELLATLFSMRITSKKISWF